MRKKKVKVLKKYMDDVLGVLENGSKIVEDPYLACVGARQGTKPFKLYKKHGGYIATLGEYEICPIRSGNIDYEILELTPRKRKWKRY